MVNTSVFIHIIEIDCIQPYMPLELQGRRKVREMQRLAVQEQKVQSSLGVCVGLLPAAFLSADSQVLRITWCSTFCSSGLPWWLRR